ncbi:MAG: hypothetical protein LBK53_04085 [Heliobacteriaceae bacterium]|jgi:hypothetical protein|nr:hypothetical protein [Heliobacteriaceae bacterium]
MRNKTTFIKELKDILNQRIAWERKADLICKLFVLYKAVTFFCCVLLILIIWLIFSNIGLHSERHSFDYCIYKNAFGITKIKIHFEMGRTPEEYERYSRMPDQLACYNFSGRTAEIDVLYAADNYQTCIINKRGNILGCKYKDNVETTEYPPNYFIK